MVSLGHWCQGFLAGLVCSAAVAQPLARDNSAAPVDLEPMSLAITGAERGAKVAGDLRLPRGAADPMATVLILHSSPGFDGRGAFYAQALNRAGIATLEVDYLGGKGIPLTARDNLPHVFQTLRYLAGHARVDPRRIGVLGFSWGGVLSLLASSTALSGEYGDGLSFAAHAGLYPICWRHHAIATGTSERFGREVYARLTGRPMLILAAENDAYEADPQSCQKFVSALPQEARPSISVTTYPGATFAWDSRFDSASSDSGVNRSRGGILSIVADAETARKSRDAVVGFFVEALAPLAR